jgi:hypothetical protein
LGCLPAFSGWLFRLWSWSICHCKFVVFPVNKIKMIFTCTILLLQSQQSVLILI